MSFLNALPLKRLNDHYYGPPQPRWGFEQGASLSLEEKYSGVYIVRKH